MSEVSIPVTELVKYVAGDIGMGWGDVAEAMSRRVIGGAKTLSIKILLRMDKRIRRVQLEGMELRVKARRFFWGLPVRNLILVVVTVVKVLKTINCHQMPRVQVRMHISHIEEFDAIVEQKETVKNL